MLGAQGRSGGGSDDPPEESEGDPWVAVARAAAEAERRPAPKCPHCQNLVSVTDKNIVKVHFAKTADVRPCLGSYVVL